MGSILAFLKYLPEIIELIKQAIKFVEDLEASAEKKAALQNLAAAIKVANDTKDTSKLEQIFNPPATPPTGVSGTANP